MSKKKSDQTMTKPVKRISLVALIFSAIVFGFIAGLGGSLLLTHSLIQRPLQDQQEIIKQQNIIHQQQLAQLKQDIVEQKDRAKILRDEIRYIITSDSTGYLKELASVQKANSNREQLYLQQVAQLEQQIKRIQDSNEAFNKNIDKAKDELDRQDKELQDNLRMLQSSLNDLKNKLQQMERQFATR